MRILQKRFSPQLRSVPQNEFNAVLRRSFGSKTIVVIVPKKDSVADVDDVRDRLS